MPFLTFLLCKVLLIHLFCLFHCAFFLIYKDVWRKNSLVNLEALLPHGLQILLMFEIRSFLLLLFKNRMPWFVLETLRKGLNPNADATGRSG